MNNLVKQIAIHTDIPYPEFPENEILSDWLVELFEVDPYYMGIADSIVRGYHLQDMNKIAIFNLESALDDIIVDKIDEEILIKCKRYVKSIFMVLSFFPKQYQFINPAIINELDQAYRGGALDISDKGILRTPFTIKVGGENITLVGGRVIDGKFHIGALNKTDAK